MTSLNEQSPHIVYLSPRLDRQDLGHALDLAGVTHGRLEGDLPLAGLARETAIVVVIHGEDLTASDNLLRSRLQQESAPSWVQGLLLMSGVPQEDSSAAELFPRFHRLSDSASTEDLVSVILNCLETSELKSRVCQLERDLSLRSRELEELNDIGIALSAERDLEALLEMILRKSRETTASDAGSLYLVEPNQIPGDDRQLRFMLSQNDSLDMSYEQFTLPLNDASIAGYVAMHGVLLNIADVYEIGDGVPYRFNKSFDRSFGYVTKSMLGVPMKNTHGEVLGVIQLINRKKDFAVKLTSEVVVDANVISFDERTEELVSSLASQAAVALENNLLYKDIENLFEGFVHASVSAIESRDPPTSGHSERVALLTLALADETSNVDAGPYRSLSFSSQQIKELRYASLLHDFGKVGVRENVLVKPKKLAEGHLELVIRRFEFIQKSTQYAHSRQELEFLLTRSRDEYLTSHPEFASQVAEALQELDSMLVAVLQANEPSVLPTHVPDMLQEIAALTYEDMKEATHPFLEGWEVKALSIPKGSLDENERKEIESHVTHSFEFLCKIPWTKELKNIPDIAYAHHEKLNGSGYPRGLASEQIPVQAKMMTISDIYDALTAADRPYKSKVETSKALNILHQEADHGQLDQDLLSIFIDRGVYELVADWKKST
ncbi:MAG: GAF domain-containing protein [Armatimonadetes bacterium]|nr:GAF domain-containing protein [Armatimonadota bacterium]